METNNRTPSPILLDHDVAPENFMRPQNDHTEAFLGHRHMVMSIGHTLTLEQSATLWSQRESIEACVKQHIQLDRQDVCEVLPQSEWRQGRYHFCVPVKVTKENGTTTKFVFRCPKDNPLDYNHSMMDEEKDAKKKAEVRSKMERRDEAMRAEVGAYVWMQEKCPEIRIPHLYGFGFSNGKQFTHIGQRALFFRLWHGILLLMFSLLQRPMLSRYTQTSTSSPGPIEPYTILEFVGSDDIKCLSSTWKKDKMDPERRKRVFKGLAKIILALAKIAQPNIGALQFNDDCTVTLSNRVLCHSQTSFENQGTPWVCQQNEMHSCTETFVSDLITIHDAYFSTQPHTFSSANICLGKTAVLTLLRAMSNRFIKRDRRYGPFLLQLTHVKSTHIFVDEDCNVVCFGGLGWISALPSEVQQPPFCIVSDNDENPSTRLIVDYCEVRSEFMRVMEEEERRMTMKHNIQVCATMNELWESRGWFFWQSLMAPYGKEYFVNTYLYGPGDDIPPWVNMGLSHFWSKDKAADTLTKKSDEYGEWMVSFFDVYTMRCGAWQGYPSRTNQEHTPEDVPDHHRLDH